MATISAKDIRRNRKIRSRYYVRYFIIIVVCISLSLLISSPSDSVDVETSSLRSPKRKPVSESSTLNNASGIMSEDATVKEATIKDSPSDPDKEKDATKNDEDEEVNVAEIETTVGDAKMDMEDAEEEEVSKVQERIMETVKTVEKNMKKVMNSLLNNLGLSSDKESEIEDEIAKRLESKVEEELIMTADATEKLAEEDLDAVVGQDLAYKAKKEDIERDVNAVRDYFIEVTKTAVDDIGKSIIQNVPIVTEQIEKDVVLEKLGIEVTDAQMEKSEIDAAVTEVKDDIEESGRNEVQKLQNQMSQIEAKVEKSIASVLGDFLQEKGITSNEIKNVKTKILDNLKNEMNLSLLSGTLELQHELGEIEEEVDAQIKDDKAVIDKAEIMGIVTKSRKKKKAQIIENDLSERSTNFGQQLKETAEHIEEDIEGTIPGMLETVEKEVLKGQGVKVTDEEVHGLVENEIKDALTQRKKKKKKKNAEH